MEEIRVRTKEYGRRSTDEGVRSSELTEHKQLNKF